jgi:hypothetical protein
VLLLASAGSYRLIGKEPDSDKTFLSKLTMNHQGRRLQILRTVENQVLRIRYGSGDSPASREPISYNPILITTMPESPATSTRSTKRPDIRSRRRTRGLKFYFPKRR